MDQIKHKCIYICGMTCVNCQNKIEKKLTGTDGIDDVKVSFQEGKAELTYDAKKISLRQIYGLVEELDYTIVQNQLEQIPDLGTVICTLVIILSFFILLEQFGILNMLAPSRLADSRMGYGMLFFVGLLTSVHCIAMCGGIQLSQCIGTGMNAKGQEKKRFGPALLYNMGRVISYTIIGCILGLVGMLFAGNNQSFGMSTILQGILKIIAGVFMVIMGTNMLGLFPALRKVQPTLPRFFMRKVGMQRVKQSSPFIVGMLNGFMPCGPLQSMQIIAFASGNPITGALSMFAFSLGTVPLMMGLGSLIAVLGKRFASKVMKVGAVLVVVLGLAMLSQGGSLSGLLLQDRLVVFVLGCSVLGVISNLHFTKAWYRKVVMAAIVVCTGFMLVLLPYFDFNRATSEVKQAYIEDGVQIVESILLSGEYPVIKVQKGIPVKWKIDASEGAINGCNYKMILRELGMEYTFQNGENLIAFTPQETGEISYSCWMGMIQGTIYVE